MGSLESQPATGANGHEWEKIRYEDEYLPHDPYSDAEIDAWCLSTGVDREGKPLFKTTVDHDTQPITLGEE